MKTAEEWSKSIGVYWSHCQGADEPHPRISPEEVAEIQSDALYHSAEFVGQMPKQYDRMRAWDAPYRAACIFARSHLREMAANLIRK